MTIDFEKDQQDAMKKTDNIQSLADQVEKLEDLQKRLELQEDNIKNTKSEIQKVSGDIIPTMMSEMGLAELKLHDGSHLKVSRRIVPPLQRQTKKRRLTGFVKMA